MSNLKSAIQGNTIYLPPESIGPDYETGEGFPSEADLQSWCDTFTLQFELITLNGQAVYKISKIIS